MIVVDVGCATHGNDDSVTALIDRFHPDELHGFDPAADPAEEMRGDTLVMLQPAAAWTHNGTVGYTRHETPTRNYTSDRGDNPVPCFDLADYLEDLTDDLVLKLDCEGAEYPLLAHLCDRGVDARLSLALVEWHRNVDHADERREQLEQRIACPLEEWA